MRPTDERRREYRELDAFLLGWRGKQGASLAALRAGFDRAETAIALPEGITSEPWSERGVSGQFLRNERGRDGRTLLFLHGGGLQAGSSKSHRHLAAAIAAGCSSDALIIDYRLAPEHKFPAALDDAISAYGTLLDRRQPGRLAIAGDSAGGGLAIAAASAGIKLGMPRPAAIACMSPWADLTCPDPTGDEAARIDDRQASLSDMRDIARAYLGDQPANNPSASPVFASLQGFPRLYLQTGSGELLLRDSFKLAAAAPNGATLEIEPGAPHGWQWFWPRLPGARRSVDNIARFLAEAFE